MVVTIDPAAGFCFGVVRAVQMAEKAIGQGKYVVSLGDLVHNEKELERLGLLGISSIEKEQLSGCGADQVLIRAHGEPPSLFRDAADKEIELADGTCPIVVKLQKRVAENYREMQKANGQVLIYGKDGHPEVAGLVGHSQGEAMVIMEDEDLGRVDFSRPIRLFAQTTMSIEGYERLKEKIASSLKGHNDFKAFNTVCGQISGRVPKLRDFARQHDIIIFVSGRKSSNGKYLFSVSKGINPATYFISSKEEIRDEWLEGAESAGVSGATSTPGWMLEEVADAIQNK